MDEVKFWVLALTCISIVNVCNCHASIVSVIKRLDQFQEDLLDNKVNMTRLEKRMLNIIDVATTELRAELKETIRDQVRSTMAEILQSDSLQDMVKREVVTEMRHLTHEHHQMKRQLHHVSRSLKDFQDETDAFQESVFEKADVWKRHNKSVFCIGDKRRLKKVCKDRAAGLKTDIERIVSNANAQSHILQLNATPASSEATKTFTSPPSSPAFTMSETTPTPNEESSRILILLSASRTHHRFHQLNIHTNSLSAYPYHNSKRVTSLAYTAKTKSLLIGLYEPTKIVSSALDTSHMTEMIDDVFATAMAVDEGRDLVFIVRKQPRYSLCRMPTLGGYFNTIKYLSYGNIPRQITLDTKRKRIYGCNKARLFMMKYNGHGLATLARGRIYAVTMDQAAGVLYYNDEETLKKMTLSNKLSTEVTTLTAWPGSMIFYTGIIYYGGIFSPIVGVVDVANDTGAYTLQTMKDVRFHQLCLIP
ncbi:uncharacterized protein [Haliotis asinina]|uniref:uncharacterized protein n=1 Tax=Haliotis asinina TaxID=109174 RepID=UPI003532683E